MEAGEGMLARPARVRIFKRKKETGKPPLAREDRVAPALPRLNSRGWNESPVPSWGPERGAVLPDPRER
jgi:hypothetical protein